jgi:hypothetical protein
MRVGRPPQIVGKKRRLAMACSLASVLFILTAACWPSGLELVIRPRAGGRVLLAVPLEPGERFTVHYIHSVDRSPVWEEHSVDRAGNIYIEEERFVMFGAGMGHWPGHGRLTTRGPHLIIEKIHTLVGDFVLRVGSRGVDHNIIWRNGRVNLSDLVPGQAVVVSAGPVSLLQRLWRGLAHHWSIPKLQES